MTKISNDWSGTGVPETGLRVDYPEVCAMYGLEEIEAVVKAMQGPIYTLSSYTKMFQEELIDNYSELSEKGHEVIKLLSNGD